MLEQIDDVVMRHVHRVEMRRGDVVLLDSYQVRVRVRGRGRGRVRVRVREMQRGDVVTRLLPGKG